MIQPFQDDIDRAIVFIIGNSEKREPFRLDPAADGTRIYLDLRFTPKQPGDLDMGIDCLRGHTMLPAACYCIYAPIKGHAGIDMPAV